MAGDRAARTSGGNPVRAHVRLDIISASVVGVLLATLLLGLLGRVAHQAQQIESYRDQELALQHQLQAVKQGARVYRQLERVTGALDFLSMGRLDTLNLVRMSNRIFHLSRTMEFDPLLVLALVSVESRGNPRAMGKFRSGTLSGAMGLMQIKVETAQMVARSLGEPIPTEQELMRPDRNLYFGTTYLLQLIHRYHSVEKGIVAYNVGPGAVDRENRTRRWLPRRYYNRVLSNYQGLVQRFGADPYS